MTKYEKNFSTLFFRLGTMIKNITFTATHKPATDEEKMFTLSLKEKLKYFYEYIILVLGTKKQKEKVKQKYK